MYNFTGDETVSDIMMACPEAVEILASYGVHCAGCFMNQSESLRAGIIGHGLGEEMLEKILADLNDASGEMINKESSLSPQLTAKAAKKILAAKPGHLGEEWGISLDALPSAEGTSFVLNFQDKAEPQDRIVISQNIRLFIPISSWEMICEQKIDYGTKDGEEGFLFNQQKESS